MKGRLPYIAFISIILVLYVVYEVNKTKPVDWRITFSKSHKGAYGSYLINETIEHLFPGKEITNSNQTIYEVKDELENQNIILFAQDYGADSLDTYALLDMVSRGNDALMAADYFNHSLRDTMHFEVGNIYQDSIKANLDFGDSLAVSFVNPKIDKSFNYLMQYVPNYFIELDTAEAVVLAANELGMPVMIKQNWGEGVIFLSTIPMAFTNYYFMAGEGHEFSAASFSYLDNRDFFWTEYYQLGRMESQSIYRFLLSEESLTWALRITIFSIFLFILFEAKRKQRIIPIVKPPQNDTLVFTRTIGNLYRQHGDHKNAAHKKISYFYGFLRSRYYLDTSLIDEDFYQRLTHKSGVPRNEIDQLFKIIISIQGSGAISSNLLYTLNQKIDEFYENTST